MRDFCILFLLFSLFFLDYFGFLDGLLHIGKKVIIDREECRFLSCITRLLSLRINYDLYRHMTVANITHAASQYHVLNLWILLPENH